MKNRLLILLIFLIPVLSGLPALGQPTAPSPAGKSNHPERLLKWRYGVEWEWPFQLSPERVSYYRHKKRPEWRGFYNYFAKFIEPGDPVVRDLANGLSESFRDYRDSAKNKPYEELIFALSLVQHLEYQDDIRTGFEDYTKYPAETLADGGGDCEDKAILCAAILARMGYSVKLVFLETGSRSHLAVGVSIKMDNGTFWEADGKKYYYLETTYPGWKPGEVPKEWSGLPGRLINVN